MQLFRFLLLPLLLVCAVVASATETYIVDCESLNVRSAPDSSAPVVAKISKGRTLDVISIDNGWAKIKYNSKDTYVSSKYLKETVMTAAHKAGLRPGPGQHFTTVTPEDFSWQFSTNRIMERIPDFGYLRGKAGNPDVWFWMTVGFFALCFALNWFADESDSYKTNWIFLTEMVCFIAGSLSETVYILASEEPLSFFSPDINSFLRCCINLIAVVIVTQAQFSLLVKLLNSIEYRSKKGFKASWTSFFVWGAIVGMVGYFVTLVFENKPDWWWWAATAVLYFFPLLLMLFSSLISLDFKPLLIGVPLYVIGTVPLVFSMSIICVVIITIFITYLLIRTALYFLGEGSLERDNIDGGYHYVFPDGSTSLFDRHSW